MILCTIIPHSWALEWIWKIVGDDKLWGMRPALVRLPCGVYHLGKHFLNFSPLPLIR